VAARAQKAILNRWPVREENGMRMVKGFLAIASILFLLIALLHALRFQEWVVSAHYGVGAVLVWLATVLVPLALSLWGLASFRRIGR
jgi:thiol:disulfide interchange protein